MHRLKRIHILKDIVLESEQCVVIFSLKKEKTTYAQSTTKLLKKRYGSWRYSTAISKTIT